MRKSLFILSLFFSINLFSQTTPDKNLYKKIAASDSVFFVVSTSGCFNAGTTEYKIVKQKNGSRKIIYLKGTEIAAKVISAKQFTAFINKYKISAEKFKEDKAPTCTLTTDFELHNKKQKSAFKNGTCQNEYNPDMYLQEFLK